MNISQHSLKTPVLGLVISLIIVGVNNLTALAASQRYPTQNELAKLRRELRQIANRLANSDGSHFVRDFRSARDKKQRDSFVSTWSKVNPAIAPFLGSWQGYEQTISIYPRYTRGSVCIIYGHEAGIEKLATGIVSNGQIRTSDQKIIFKEGNYLGLAGIHNNKATLLQETPLHSPNTLKLPTQDNAMDSALAVRIIRQFKANGCTASLPKKK